jgi:cellulose synthase/poly-beta-1,6-N-acetylglucosamine synthase-like glycosyltransferase
MVIIKVVFWILIILIFYSYIGYGILLYIILLFKRLITIRKKTPYETFEPEVTIFVPAFNEIDFVEAKVENTFSMDYPSQKIEYIWVTDGSNDGTPDLLSKYDRIKVFHQTERNGKIGAMNKGIHYVTKPIVIFTDANTSLNTNAIKEIVKLFSDKKVGCVSGEKRISLKNAESAAGAGEGIYWKYESLLKKWDSELNSVIGAAGELFAIRTELYEEVESDTLLDDFIISMRIAEKGYKIKYNPDAFAVESSSANIKEEIKRKIRISAGAIQSTIRLKKLLNPMKFPLLSFQFFSHKVLRWFFVPLSILLIFPLNIVLFHFSNCNGTTDIYSILLWLQIIFYLLVFFGFALKNTKVQIKFIFVPYYMIIMNLSVFLGAYRYFKKKQSVNWERAKRNMN